MGKTLAIIVLIFVIGLVLVWWFNYRPEAIREMCLEEQQVRPLPKRPGETFKRRTRSYYDCLKENGLDK